MNKKTIISLVVVLALIVAIILLVNGTRSNDMSDFKFTVQRGTLETTVNASGELLAENSTFITGPVELRSNNVRINNVRIQNLVAEGTMVRAGDWVATLDRTEADLTLKNMEDQVQNAEVSFSRAQIDTTITLSGLRDNMVNLRYTLEERELNLELSKFEPAATIRQAEIEVDRARRALAQSEQNYIFRKQQSEERMAEARINLQRTVRRYEETKDAADKFVVTAPTDGMVIYHREWNGRQRSVGSQINARDLIVAVMPDMSSMVSRTLINEIDISRVSEGLPVRLSIDAIPDRRYTGTILSIANVGQQSQNSESKVFEVFIKLDSSDPLMRPSMSTSNTIITNSFHDVLFVPIEAIYVSEDNIPFVFTASGNKQAIITGAVNGNNIIIEDGLSEGDVVYTTLPKDHESYKITGHDLIARYRSDSQTSVNSINFTGSGLGNRVPVILNLGR